MKRISSLIFVTVLPLCFLISCGGGGSPVPPASSNEIWITHSVIKKIAQNKGIRSDTAKKMHSNVLELVEQFKENGGSFTLPFSAQAGEDLFERSLARRDSKGRVFFYLYRDTDVTSLKDFKFALAGIGLSD